jgi:hypothetical protein
VAAKAAFVIRGGIRVVPAQRWWVAALVAVAVVTAGALAWSIAPWTAQTYVATRDVLVIVLPGDATGAHDAYVAQERADAIASALAGGALVSSDAFAGQVVREVGAHAHAGSALATISPAAVAHALQASHRGNVVTLSATWDSPGEASALADAAAQTLAAMGVTDVQALPAEDARAAASVRVEVMGTAAVVRGDTGAAWTRAAEIAERGALAAAAIVILAGTLSAISRRGRHGTEVDLHAAETKTPAHDARASGESGSGAKPGA